MSLKTETITRQKLLELAKALSPTDLHWLADQLHQLLDEEPLPERASLDEAIKLYLADKCSLGRAAELAGVTPSHIQDILYERNLFLEVYGHHSRAEIEALNEKLEREGVLAEHPSRPFDEARDTNCLTTHEAIGLYLADKCSLGRAAELAGVTRWDIADILKERDIPIYGGSDMTVEDMDDLVEQLKEQGIL